MRDLSTSTASHAEQWLGLALTPALGPTRARRLVEHFGNVERVFQASLTELEAAGVSAVSAQAIALGKSLAAAQEEAARAGRAGVQIIALDDPLYPPLLKQIYDPPLVLYVRGNTAALSQPGMAVIGTRHPTPYGMGMAERLSCDLGTRGMVIISGMARGVDTAAHRGCLAGRGKTVAVFGTGVDVIYPRENTRLAEQILALEGALVSEFALGAFAAPQNFPIRNRIISRLAFGALVVEAGEYSGTSITARLRAGAEPRGLCGSRKRYQPQFLGAQYAHQARRQAGGYLGRRVGRTAAECATCTAFRPIL